MRERHEDVRAVIFDLDETLYPERRFMLSGFAAVACWLETHHGASARRIFRTMVATSRRRRDCVFQHVCDVFDLPATLIPILTDTYRYHRPRLRLPDESRRILEALRADYRLAVLTNGVPVIQRGKVSELGLEPLVDSVVYACEHGTREGKPDPATFHHVLADLGVAPPRAVFVGDDPWCDIAGARQAGLRTIRLRRGIHRCAPVAPASDADVVVPRLGFVPDAVALLLDRPEAHVA
jgi:putative hydrolase of the HAD superfamily